jgi:hypothetical protein
MSEYQTMQDIWQNINSLGALIATPGIEEETKKVANEQVRKLLEALTPVLTRITAKASGLTLTS